MASLTGSEVTISLAADVLRDHFGTVAALIGQLLIEKGSLSLQEVLQYARQGLAGEEIRFPAARNALLTLVRHGVVTASPHPQVADGEARGVMMVYVIDIDDVLVRLRFPHFLEYALAVHGPIAYQLVFAVLRYGRCSAGFAFLEALRLDSNCSGADVESEFRKLVGLGLLRAVDMVQKQAQDEAAAEASSASADARGETSDTDLRRLAGQKRQRDEDAKHGIHDSTSIVATGNSAVPERKGDDITNVVYTFNTGEWNLCLCKSILCRIAEERINGHAALVLTAMLSSVRLTNTAARVSTEYMRFSKVEQRMQDIGARRPGADPKREHEKLVNVLDFMATHPDGLVRKRLVKVSSNEDTGDGDNDGTRRGAGRKGRSPATPAATVQGSVVVMQEVPEWTIDWMGVRRLLLNSAVSQLVRDQFGMFGLRVFNLLVDRQPPQKLEDKDIFQHCMVPQESGRETLNKMVARSVVMLQEVPKSAAAPLAASFWLYYVDHRRAEIALFNSVVQATLNMRVRFRVETAKVAPLESRGSFGGLTSQECRELDAGRKREDALERTVLSLDTAALMFRCI
eukprot:TRINITY_DN49306_c0_g1_i1.p1 TRINITY_DN49306_c0_g1~~TRINITY_DN49306_c0_g1_i1.p1  ORF type:complete len:571 (+),score=86.76 TRINITY_DN49306_c0_g1_i1:76-1788(+)